MPSPFPGMDPFIEINPRWKGLHAWLVRELARQSLSKAQTLACWIDVEWNGPIVAITGCASPEGRQRCLEAGCNEYLAKPISLRDLQPLLAR